MASSGLMAKECKKNIEVPTALCFLIDSNCKELQMKRFLVLLALLCGWCLAELKFDFRNEETHLWEARRGIELIPGAEGLSVKIINTVNELFRDNLNLNAADADSIEIRYRANFPAPLTRTGYIFFAAKGQGFNENQKFYLPKLIADGTPQRIVVGFKQLRGGAEAWRNCGVVDKVRIDLTNEAPGTVELLSIRFTTAAKLTLEYADSAKAWNFPADSAKWSGQRNLERSAVADGIRLNITGYDSNIEHKDLNFDAATYQRIKIEYKASGFAKSTSGEIFFATASAPEYNGGVYFRVPSLVADGKWHTMILDANKDIPAGVKYWIGTIRKMRLDIVNEFPGEIILKKIEVLPPASSAPEEATEIKASKPGWLYPKEAFLDGKLDLTLPPAEYSLYFYGDKPNGFSAKPALANGGNGNFLGRVNCADGKLHLEVKALPETCSIFITVAKEQPVVQGHGFPAKVKVDIGKPEGQKIAKHVVFDRNMPYWKGKLIYPQGAFYAVGDCAARHTFKLDGAKIQKAVLQISADDVIQRVALNGKDVKGRLSGNWKEPSVFDVTAMLQAGKNVLAVKWRNNGSAGGLLYELDVLYDSGKFVQIASGKDSRTRTADGIPADWTALDSREAGFSAAEMVNAAPYSPWTYVLPFVDIKPPHGDVNVKIDAPKKAGDVKDVVVKVKLSGTPALEGDEIGWLYLEMPDGTQIQALSDELQKMFKRGADGSYSAEFRDLALPQVGGKLDIVFKAGVHGRTARGETSREMALLDRKLPDTGVKLESKLVASDNGSPIVMVNGKPFFPVLLSTFFPKKATGFEHRKQGVNVRVMVAGGTATTWWTGPDTYNFSQVDQRINEYLRETPDAYISAYIWCMPPNWYEKTYPERISMNSDGKKFDYYVATVTFSGEEYRKDAKKALNAIVNHLEEQFGSRILIYNLVGGISYEWQGWGAHSMAQHKRLADYGPTAQRDFKNYAAKRGVMVNGVPSYEERMHSLDGIFRNPAADAVPMLYDEYYSESIATCITEFAKEVKTILNRRKLVGAYYGYLFEYANMEYCINSAGHNALKVLLDSPDVDYALSPQSYGHRAIGYPMEDMKPFASLWKHGKMSIMEDDMRTHKTEATDFYQSLNLDQTRAVFQRDWALMLSRRTPIYVFPIVGGNEADDPAIRADLEQARRAGQYIFEKDLPRKAEIAVVVDEKSWRYLAPHAGRVENPTARMSWYAHNGARRDPHRATQQLTGDLVYVQRERLGQCGAPYDSILLTDVKTHASEYKLWIFLNDFEDSATLQDAVAAIKKTGGSMLVTYGAGFIGKDGISAEKMSRLFGIELKQIDAGPLQVVWTTPSQDGSARVLFGPTENVPLRFACADKNATTYGRFVDCNEAAIARKGKVVFFGGNQLQPEFIAQVAKEAGVHIWCAPGDALSAGSGIVSLHSARSGKKHIALPQASDVVDVFTKQVVARNVTSIDIDIPALTTRTFLLGNSEEILKALNKEW